MITTLVLLAVLVFAGVLVLLGILGIANRIDNNVQEAHDNIHRIRAGFERERHRFQELIESVARIEGHVKG